jgi:hypothetical protein
MPNQFVRTVEEIGSGKLLVTSAAADLRVFQEHLAHSEN